MNGYSLISHKLCTDQSICCCYRFGEGEEGWNFFSLVSQSRALNKEQCPIYWRVVLMMIRYSPICSLNVVGMYLKFDFRCRCTICFLSFDFVQCQYVHATDVGLGDLLSSLGEITITHFVQETFSCLSVCLALNWIF